MRGSAGCGEDGVGLLQLLGYRSLLGIRRAVCVIEQCFPSICWAEVWMLWSLSVDMRANEQTDTNAGMDLSESVSPIYKTISLTCRTEIDSRLS